MHEVVGDATFRVRDLCSFNQVRADWFTLDYKRAIAALIYMETTFTFENQQLKQKQLESTMKLSQQ